MFKEDKGFESLQVSPWPKFNAALVDEEAEKNGDLIIAIIGEVRHDKAEKKLPLNAPVKKLNYLRWQRRNAKVVVFSQGRYCWNIKGSKHRSPAEKPTEGRQVSPYEVYIKIEYEAKA